MTFPGGHGPSIAASFLSVKGLNEHAKNTLLCRLLLQTAALGAGEADDGRKEILVLVQRKFRSFPSDALLPCLQQTRSGCYLRFWLSYQRTGPPTAVPREVSLKIDGPISFKELITGYVQEALDCSGSVVTAKTLPADHLHIQVDVGGECSGKVTLTWRGSSFVKWFRGASADPAVLLRDQPKSYVNPRPGPSVNALANSDLRKRLWELLSRVYGSGVVVCGYEVGLLHNNMSDGIGASLDLTPEVQSQLDGYSRACSVGRIK
jgi:hypothetical protein